MNRNKKDSNFAAGLEHQLFTIHAKNSETHCIRFWVIPRLSDQNPIRSIYCRRSQKNAERLIDLLQYHVLTFEQLHGFAHVQEWSWGNQICARQCLFPLSTESCSEAVIVTGNRFYHSGIRRHRRDVFNLLCFGFLYNASAVNFFPIEWISERGNNISQKCLLDGRKTRS